MKRPAHNPTANISGYREPSSQLLRRLAKAAGLNFRRTIKAASGPMVGVLLASLMAPGTCVNAQKRESPKHSAKERVRPTNRLSELRDEYIKATKEFKASLEKLLAFQEANVSKAEEHLAQSKTLLSEGLISKSQYEEGERAVADARDKVNETKQRMAGADMQIANTLVEAEADRKMARMGPIARGALVKTAALVRYNGPAAWGLSDAWKIQRFFLETYRKPLPIAVFGQGSIHDRWRLDHRNAMDISLNPDDSEGQGLMNFLRSNGIPFLAFRQAIPGTATGPHIHIGRPSHRY
jgi:Outer membrane efflux protein